MANVTVTAEAVIDPADYLDDISTEDLEAELESRNDRSDNVVPLCKEALDMLHGGRVHDAIELLEKTLYPKWYDEHECRRAYEKALDERYLKKSGKLPAYRGAGGHAHS